MTKPSKKPLISHQLSNEIEENNSQGWVWLNTIVYLILIFLINYFNFNFIIGNSSGKENNPIVIDALNSQSITEIFYSFLKILYNIIKIKKINSGKKKDSINASSSSSGRLVVFFLKKIVYVTNSIF